jgi:hypothetical protein
MSEWTKVVTEPLGLAGFALFLVFGLVAKRKSKDERRWITPLAAFMAVCALLGGIFLSYKKSGQPAAMPPGQTATMPVTKQQTNTKVIQETTGQGSPAVQGVQGDVTITIDQSSGTAKKKPPDAKKPAPEKSP